MSEVKVNKISPRTNCGTVTLGDSGDTFTIPAGATITNNGTAAGFGATGAASWDTTVKTSGFTAVSGVGYFVNTTSGAITVTLPASPDAGAVVAVKDYANTFDTNAVTLARNGSNIGGEADDATLSTEGLAVTLVYVDATQGWLVTDNGTQDTAPTAQYVTATGGTITCCGDYRIHTFTGPGTLCVSCAGNAQGSTTVDYLVVAGGGGGGWANGGGGGGGAGGLRYSASTYCNPAPAPSAGSALPVSITTYPIIVGGGGAYQSGSPDYKQGNTGSNSTFSTITSAGGGGGGGGYCGSNGPGLAGGSGGGGGKGGPTYGSPQGNGNTPPVSPPQGNNGGAGGGPVTPVGNSNHGGGGGGAGAPGGCAGPGLTGGCGGNGLVVAINGSCAAYAGGGGGQSEGQPAPAQGQGGSGGGGSGGQTGADGAGGSANTGGGGGGGDSQPNSGVQSGSGGSGIVIIRYKFQN